MADLRNIYDLQDVQEAGLNAFEGVGRQSFGMGAQGAQGAAE